jgi:predicted dehydrogenase
MIPVAVVGVGSLGEHHARIYGELPQAQLAGVCDLDHEKGQRVAAALSTRFFSNAEELLGKVEAVSIAVPTSAHARVAELFLKNGVHVLVEKPIASSLTEARSMIAAAASSGCLLQIGHLERFNPAVLALQPLVTRPLFFEGHRLSVFVPRSLDIDVVLDLMIHDLDLVLALTRSDIVQIHALGIPILTPKIDIANARIEFANGCVANLTASRVSDEKVRKLRFFQPHDYVSIDFLKREAEIVSLQDAPTAVGKQIMRRKLETRGIEPLKAEITAFLDSASKGTEPVCSGSDGLRALDAAFRVLKAMGRRPNSVELSAS